MKWFGEWSGPFCDPADGRLEAPVGERCGWCEEAIAAGDSGVVIPGFGGGETIEHRECFRRAVLGSIAHQYRRCSCYVPGSDEGDPPQLTRREAAKLVDVMIETRIAEQRRARALQDVLDEGDDD